MVQPTVYEQYMLELLNRTRLDFDAEITRIALVANQDEDGDGDIDYQDTLNYGRQAYITKYGLDPNDVYIFTSGTRQVLAFNSLLTNAARSHSQWMLDTDIFSHYETDSSVESYTGYHPGERARAAGYDSYYVGENIAWYGSTNATLSVQSSHEGLFKSFGHRLNIMNNNYRELGIGIGEGVLTYYGQDYNVVMNTQKFGQWGSSVFLTGVTFDDSVIDDDFYTVGEGLSGIQIKATRQSDHQIFTTNTMDAGGYQIALSPGNYDVEFSQNGTKIGNIHTVTINSQNVKLDLDTSNIVDSPTIPIPAIRINAGGNDYTDTSGKQWSGSKGFSNGGRFSRASEIAQTKDDFLYQSEHFGRNFSYQQELANGSYDVTLHFAEIYFNQAGKRVFDVTAEDQLILDDFDIYNEARGKDIALEKTFTVDVNDGTLDLDFLASVDNAKISAVEIKPADTIIRVNGGGNTYTDALGQEWLSNQGFSNGGRFSRASEIAQTEDDFLYQSEHFGRNFSYQQELANGSYDVTLHFAEIYFNQAGKRVFDVTAEDQLILDDFDIYNEAGGKDIALKKTFTVGVNDGTLDLDFLASVDNAKISALEIRPSII